MAFNPKYTDREGQGRSMVRRTVRLTEEENGMLDEILAKTGYTLRDLIAELVEERWMEEFNNGK